MALPFELSGAMWSSCAQGGCEPLEEPVYEDMPERWPCEGWTPLTFVYRISRPDMDDLKYKYHEAMAMSKDE